MTYDIDNKGSFDGLARHHSPLYAIDNSNLYVDYTVKFWIRNGVPAQKLILGIPSFGQSRNLTDAENYGLHAPTNGPGMAGGWTKTPGTLAYYEICKDFFGWSVVRDAENRMGPFAHSKNQWVSFDDVENVRAKGNYINDMHLGGGMIWTLDFDDFTNYCGCGNYPLLTTLNQALHRIDSEPINNCT